MNIDLSLFCHNDWESIESELEDIADPKIKGDLFEYFANYYLRYFENLYDIKEIYCPIADGTPFPPKILKRLNLESRDYGVDGVFITHSNELCAWQAKFRSKRNVLTARELGTFWAEAEYADFRMVISNTRMLPGVSKKKRGHLSVLVDKFEHLDNGFFQGIEDYYKQSRRIHREKKIPRDYQYRMLDEIRGGFSTSRRGKAIAACGIGKTLVSLWAVEEMDASTTIFFAPSLQLIRQTLEDWAMEANKPFRYLCVCSDQTVDADIDQNTMAMGEVDIPVTTDPKTVHGFLKGSSDNEKKYVFSTYHSAEVIGKAVARLNNSFRFDVAVFDEAHRTAGLGGKNSMSIALDDSVVPADKKLFLTATERLVRPRLQKAATEQDIKVFSMNDEAIYGPVFSRLSFGKAIEEHIISDYRIVLSGFYHEDLAGLLKENRYVVGNEDEGTHGESIDNLFKREVLRRAIEDLGIRKIITFHSNIREAKAFTNGLNDVIQEVYSDVYVSHINGAMSAQSRAEIIREFESSEVGVITNVRCLTEGIDIPLIDGVFFADSKGSMIDIVQAVGRALRQPFGRRDKTAYIILPVLIDETTNDTLSGQGFESLFNLIQAMRDQDHMIADWIDSINQDAVRGRIYNAPDLGKILIRLPSRIDLEEFSNALALKIADVNRDPAGTIGIGSTLGRSQRKGSIPRVFKTMMDYTPDKCETSIVIPTFSIIDDTEAVYPTSKLRINNNNVSHCKRLGLIKEVERSKYTLSKIGKRYNRGEIAFETVFRNQMMLYSELVKGSVLFPYRIACQFLLSLGKLNYIEFLFSLYSLAFDNNGKPEFRQAVSIAKDIRKCYPQILLTNESNKRALHEELNDRYGSDFSYENVWTDRTTAANQFRYLGRHLELFEGVFSLRKGWLAVDSMKTSIVEEILQESAPFINTDHYGDTIWIGQLSDV